MPNFHQGTPAPPHPDLGIPRPSDFTANAGSIARLGMNGIADLGRLFHIIVHLTDPGSAAYQMARTGMQMAEARRRAIDGARVSAEYRRSIGTRTDRR
ncbi:hypothetical protein [Andreprevotia chitinilytica]|uniref:hypothetical protein n=1 Tax=Andreprevotia chitinilytica TaxID=396808 RepID=UPI000551A707|nr:hypothetical protein [Andreprevotia chitinilytica]